MRIIDASDDVVEIDRSGIIMESNAGTLVLASSADGNSRIYRSTDDGATWSLRQAMTMPTGGGNGVRGAFVDSRGHLYYAGTEQNCTYENYASAYFGELWKSADDGVTWSKVCTSESSGFWHIVEDTAGRIYVNEYSLTPSSGTEYPAKHIWRSDTNGANFTKWHTATAESGAGLKDGVRHIHTVYVDSADRVFTAYGDTGWAGLAGHVVRLDADGAVDIDYGAFGNGMTSMIEATAGVILLGADRNPSGIEAISATAALSCSVVNLRLAVPSQYDAYVFDLLRGQGGVIWGQTTLSNRDPLLMFSLDDGDTWHALDLGSAQSTTMCINRSAPRQRIYLSGNPVRWIPAYTVAQLRKMIRSKLARDA